MIKSLFQTDEDDETKPEIKDNTETAVTPETLTAPRHIEVNEAEEPFEMSELTFDKVDDVAESLSADEIENINSFVETAGAMPDFPETRLDSSEELSAETTNETINSAPSEITSQTINQESHIADAETVNLQPSAETVNYEMPAEIKQEETREKNNDGLLFQSTAPRESLAETARKSGLAYAAAITLFGAVIFMLIIGWFADLLLGSSPWGIVGGIVLGAVIGFIQLFRMTSQIFKGEK